MEVYTFSGLAMLIGACYGYVELTDSFKAPTFTTASLEVAKKITGEERSEETTFTFDVELTSEHNEGRCDISDQGYCYR